MKRALIALAALLPALALAHVGADHHHHDSALLAGFTHPFTGLDHLAAMVAVGVWSTLAFRHAGRAQWAVPAAFALLLLLGGIAGFAGLALPVVESVIAASLVLLGLFVATRLKMPLPAAAALVGAFAVFHGVAHGVELAGDSAVAALGGMVAGTLILHLTGMALGAFVLNRHVWLPRIAGLSVALFGVSLLAF